MLPWLHVPFIHSANIRPTTKRMKKSLDQKMARLRSDPSSREFILTDAKDADLALGLASPGPSRGQQNDRFPYRSIDEFRDLIREITQQQLVDVMLMSPRSNELLTIDERLFDDSPVTPAARANDTSDVWLGMSGIYAQQPALPHSTTTVDHIQSGRYPGDPEVRDRGADLALFSVTFNNDARHDLAMLQAYKAFRLEAEEKGLRHFIEVFAPNAPVNPVEDVPRFVNDAVARTLAGITGGARPLFVKMPYFGPAAMEQLVHYDPSMIVGILGGSSGTTMDAFHMLWEAKKYGARAAFYGRKINNAEDQLTMVRYLRAVADDEIEPAEAVHAYHADLKQADIRPLRSLEEDLQRSQ